MPVEPPADTTTAPTGTWWGHPVLDVVSEGPGVVACRDELPACEAATGDAPVVVRSGEVDPAPFHVLLEPPSAPGTTGELTRARQDHRATVVSTSAVPDRAGEPARAGAHHASVVAHQGDGRVGIHEFDPRPARGRRPVLLGLRLQDDGNHSGSSDLRVGKQTWPDGLGRGRPLATLRPRVATSGDRARIAG
ncbi:hypothetical protein [Kineococcus esterisolvens]|uniref:hypothetical protein n=1 Tax=unclassified Kineococcus TaxID=2621656 RepID=UPI003D7DB628